jgi:hypothetical protein
MPSKIILHNAVSLDRSFVNFETPMGLHDQIAGHYRPYAHLISSNTIIKGTVLYGDEVPGEEKSDLENLRDNGFFKFFQDHYLLP